MYGGVVFSVCVVRSSLRSSCVARVVLVSFVSFGARLVCQAIRPSARLACTCPVPLRWLLPLFNSSYTPFRPHTVGTAHTSSIPRF